MARQRAPRPTSTFPSSFPRLFAHVMATEEPFVIEGLERNEKAEYTSLRARLNEYRRARLEEARNSGNLQQIKTAESFYAITIREPVQVNGLWQMTVELKEQKAGDVLDKLLPPPTLRPVPRSGPSSELGARNPEPTSPIPLPESQSAIAIKDLYKSPPAVTPSEKDTDQ